MNTLGAPNQASTRWLQDPLSLERTSTPRVTFPANSLLRHCFSHWISQPEVGAKISFITWDPARQGAAWGCQNTFSTKGRQRRGCSESRVSLLPQKKACRSATLHGHLQGTTIQNIPPNPRRGLLRFTEGGRPCASITNL